MQSAGQATLEPTVPAKVDRDDWRGVLAVTFAYLLLTGWLSLELNVWRDEMYSLHSSSGSIARAAWRAIEFELQPPVYFALLAAWRSLDDSIFFARLLSSIFGAGAILVVAIFARRHLPRVRPLYAAAIVASHPFLIWAGTEVRVYALVVLLSALMTLAFFDTYWLPAPPWRRRLVFAGLALASAYTQYYLLLLVLCFGVALLVRKHRPGLVAYALDMTGVMVSCLPLALALRGQLGAHHEDLGRPLALGLESLRRMVVRFEAYIFSFNQAIDEARWSLPAMRIARWAYRALIAVVIAIGLVRLGRVRSSLRGAGPIAAALGAYAVCMVGLFVSVGPMSVGERHTAGLLIPVLLAATAAPAFALGRKVAHIWTLVLVLSNVAATTLTQVLPRAKDCDCRRVAETITQNETVGEPVLVFPSEDVMPLSVYYHGRNRLVAVPRPPSDERWDQSTFVIRSPDDVARALGTRAGGLWVHTNTYGPTWGPDKLEDFLGAGYRLDQRQEFAHGVVLRHFVRDTASDARLRAGP
jgi:hypothetical protein